ncbi:RNA polymerase sigma-70 factor [Belliella sp. R4-6]|uniref:RNA polymerase sigma-70 factor n=1 Tax=Belliella alkalica TaxID=1730871 RepID=A0ABS9VBL1_9BACT|nr:RNA polymerase sigma-70 factor [Belliella alkalica]MCH7413824.1 RNA polymerase sigma-70 factor [Belliella alkalica]
MLLTNSPKKFEEIFNEYWEVLYSAAFVRTKDQAVTEDIVQEIFIDFWQRRNEIKIKTSLKAYLLTAVKYKVIKHFAHSDLYLQNTKDHEEIAMYDDDNLEFEDLYDALEIAIDKLSPKCQMIFKMSRIEGYSADEIASQLKISTQTVHNQLSKSLGIVRKELKHLSPLVILLIRL